MKRSATGVISFAIFSGGALALAICFGAFIVACGGCEPTPDPEIINTQNPKSYYEDIHSITLTPGSVSLLPGGGKQFTATVMDRKNKPLSIKPGWELSVEGVVEVNSEGFVRAISPGKTLLYAVVGAVKSASASIEVLADTTPPIFKGCAGASEGPHMSLTLYWQAALDDVSGTENIEYRVYFSKNEANIDYSTPVIKTSAGALWTNVSGENLGEPSGIQAARPYFFSVRAVDEAGNEDKNAAVCEVMLGLETDPVVVTQEVSSLELESLVLFVSQDVRPGIFYVFTTDRWFYSLNASDPANPILREGKQLSDISSGARAFYLPEYDSYRLAAADIDGVKIFDTTDLENVPFAARPDKSVNRAVLGLTVQGRNILAFSHDELFRIEISNSSSYIQKERLPLRAGDKAIVADDANPYFGVIYKSGLIEIYGYDTAGDLKPLGGFGLPPNPIASEWRDGVISLAYETGALFSFAFMGGKLELLKVWNSGENVSKFFIGEEYLVGWFSDLTLRSYRSYKNLDIMPLSVQGAIWKADALSISGGIAALANHRKISLIPMPPFVRSAEAIEVKSGLTEGEIEEGPRAVKISFSKPIDISTITEENLLVFEDESHSSLYDFRDLEISERELIIPLNREIPASSAIGIYLSDRISDKSSVSLYPPGGHRHFITRGERDPNSPVIFSFTPDQAPPGEFIEIEGRNFSLNAIENRVFFSDKEGRLIAPAAKPTVNETGTRISAKIPKEAYTGRVLVSTPNGSDISAQTLNVLHPPIITRIQPRIGAAGAFVTITGEHFGKRPSSPSPVMIGALEMAFDPSSYSDDAILAVVPEGAVTAPIKIATAGGTTQSSDDFEVVKKPEIFSFSPEYGVVGSVVEIIGRNFGASEGKVYFSSLPGQSLNPAELAEGSVWTDSAVRVIVPEGAINGPISIVTRDSVSDASATEFSVFYPPEIIEISPQRNGAGEGQLVVTGKRFNSREAPGVNKVYIGAIEAPIGLWNNTKIIADIPAEAVDGRVKVVNGGGYEHTGPMFYVMEIADAEGGEAVSPSRAPVNALVKIKGKNFGGEKGSVEIGAKPVEAIHWRDNEITVRIGQETQTGIVKVISSDGGSVRGPTFTLIPTPNITGITPLRAGVGHKVTIVGSGFGSYSPDNSAVYFGGNLKAQIEDSPNSWRNDSITVIVPEGTISGPIRIITEDDVEAVSPQSFLRIRFCMTGAFMPSSGTANTEVSICAENLGPPSLENEVEIGGQAASILEWKDSSILARVGPSAKDGAIRIKLQGGEFISADQNFYILPPIINSFSPQRAGPGMTVTVNGKNFQGQIAESGVNVNGISAQIAEWKFPYETVKFYVPDNAEFSGLVSLTAASGKTAVSADPFEFVPAPKITQVTPADAPVGYEYITIAGENFQTIGIGTRTQFRRGANTWAALATLVDSPTQIRVKPPNIATNKYSIIIQTDGGEVTAKTDYQLFNAPITAELEPPNALYGEQIYINGGDFEPTAAANVSVAFEDAAPIQPEVTSLTSLTLLVPNDVSHGPLKISSRAGEITTEWFFVIKAGHFHDLAPAEPISLDAAIVGGNERAFIVNGAIGEIIEFDISSESVAYTYAASETGGDAKIVKICNGGTRLCAAKANGQIRVFNAATRAHLGDIAIEAGAEFKDIAANGSTLWATYAHNGSHFIERADTTTFTVAGIKREIAEGTPIALAIHPTNGKGYVVISGVSPRLLGFDANSLVLDAEPFALNADPKGLALVGGYALVIHNAPSFDYIDLSGGAVIKRSLPAQASAIAAEPEGAFARATLPTLQSVGVIDIDNYGGFPSENADFMSYLGKIHTGGAPSLIAFLKSETVGEKHKSVIINDERALVKLNGFTTLDMPFVYKFAPESAAVGQIVTVTGKNFKAAQGTSKIYFGELEADTITSWDNTEIKAEVPVGATTCKIKVITDGGGSRSKKRITIF